MLYDCSGSRTIARTYTPCDTHSGWLVSTSRNYPVTDTPPGHTGLLPPSFCLSLLPRQPLVLLQLTALADYTIQYTRNRTVQSSACIPYST